MKDKLPLLIYAALALLVMLPYFGPGYFLALDMVWGPSSFDDFQFPDLYEGKANPYGAYLPYRLVFAALAEVFTVEVVEKLLLFSILLLAGACAHYALPEKLGLSRYFAGTFYMLNPFVFIRFLAGHWAILLSYAFWPIALKTFFDFLKDPLDRRRSAKAALMTLMASVSVHSVLMLLLSYLVLFLLHLALREKRPQLLIGKTALLGLTVLAMNLFWILPAALLFGSEYSPASPEAYLKDFSASGQEMGVGAAVLTLHGFWRAGYSYLKDIFEWWYVPFIAILGISIYGVYGLLREDALMALFLVSLFLIAFVFALGIESPLAGLIAAAGEFVPITFIFRDSHKFVGLLALCYSFAGAYGVHYLSQRLNSRYLLLLVLMPLLYNWGFFFYQSQVGLSQYPGDWSVAQAIIANDSTPGNILVFSQHHYASYAWADNLHKTLPNPASQFFSRPVVTSMNLETQNIYSDRYDPYGWYINHLFDNRRGINSTAELLLPVGARYVIIMKDDPDSVHFLYLFSRKAGVEDIELVYEGSTIYLFRNELVQGPFMATEDEGSSGSLIGNAEKAAYSPDVTYQKTGPSSYDIINASASHVVFAEPLSGFWQYEEGPVSSWRHLGTSFAFDEGGTFFNSLAPFVQALFVISWLMALILILGADRKTSAALIALAAALLYVVIQGYLAPALLGWMVLFSVGMALIPVLWQSAERSRQSPLSF